ncbi:hypothetical protein ACFP3I_17925 [Chryseobacterium arachidis]|uniref:hypothetical protein n=1 Tax=Chryseobacterium arachidis TaxID=1416778 RepID=UPI003618A3DC
MLFLPSRMALQNLNLQNTFTHILTLNESFSLMERISFYFEILLKTTLLIIKTTTIKLNIITNNNYIK